MSDNYDYDLTNNNDSVIINVTDFDSKNNPVKNETMYSKIFQLDNGMTRYEFKNSAGEISKVKIRDSKGEVIYEYLKPDYDNGWTVTEKISDNLEKETSLTYYDDYISYYQGTYNNSEKRESLQINRDLEGNVISKIIHSGNKTIINHYEPDGNITTDTYDWR